MENGRLLRHFGLVTEPFRVAPRRRDFFPPGGVPQGVSALTGSPEADPARLLIVTGDSGTGRSSMLRQIAAMLRPAGWRVFTVETGAVPHPEHLSDDDILLAACRNFGLFRAMTERKANAAAANLRAEVATGPAKGPIAIAVDDADRLADAALAGLLRLAILMPAHAHARAEGETLVGVGRAAPDLAVLLAGPPDLRQRLDAIATGAGLPPLGKSAAADFALRPLTTDEVGAYVEYCLDVAGSPDTDLFDAAAIERLTERSHGVLGELNAIAAQAMIFAWQSSRRRITADLIEPPGGYPPISAPSPAVTARALVLVPGQDDKAETLRAKRRRRLAWGASCLGLLVGALVVGAVTLPGGRDLVRSGSDFFAAAFSTPVAPSLPANGVDDAFPQGASGTVHGQRVPPPTGAESVAPSSGIGALVGTPDALAAAADAGASGEATAEFLVARGEILLRGSDAVSARRFFSRAAETGSAAAATAMAASYDPVFLERSAIRGVDTDPEQAAAWYRIAIARGDPIANERLDALVASMAAPPQDAQP